ncbi:hypothetical protein ACEPAF_5541 [Sanghuangporus sanghuang]
MSNQETATSIANDLFIIRCTSVATLCVFVYDYLCTLDDEVRLVWKSRISLVKCVFIANRILAFGAAIMGVYLFLLNSHKEHCYSVVVATSLIDVLIFITGEIILFTRVYAIWGGRRTMVVILTIFYLAGACGALYASIKTTLTVTVEFIPELFGPGCLVAFESKGFWICYFVLLIHETAMLFLIVIRSIYLNRQVTSRTVNMLIKDGVLYFIAVLLMTLGNMLLLFLGPAQLRGFLIILQGILHSILCARLLLRLRGVYRSLAAEGMRTVSLLPDYVLTSNQNEIETRIDASIVLTSFSKSSSVSP